MQNHVLKNNVFYFFLSKIKSNKEEAKESTAANKKAALLPKKFHRLPKIKLAGKAASPSHVYWIPIAVPRSSSFTISVTKALEIASVNAKESP